MYGLWQCFGSMTYLVWIRIRIRGSMPQTNGPDPTFKMPTKNQLKKKISAYYFLKVHLHHFSKIKSLKEVKKEEESRLIDGSGSGSIPGTSD